MTDFEYIYSLCLHIPPDMATRSKSFIVLKRNIGYRLFNGDSQMRCRSCHEANFVVEKPIPFYTVPMHIGLPTFPIRLFDAIYRIVLSEIFNK